MANRTHRRRRPKITDADIELAARITSATRGCTCTPHLRRRHTDGTSHVDILHDADCPASNTGSALILKPNQGHRNAP